MEIEISKELRNKIENLQYEVEARKDLISYMLSSNFNTDSEQFKKYETEYHNFFVEYNKAKNELVETYLKGIDYNSWNLDFATCIVKVELK